MLRLLVHVDRDVPVLPHRLREDHDVRLPIRLGDDLDPVELLALGFEHLADGPLKLRRAGAGVQGDRDRVLDRLWRIFCWIMIYGAVITLPLWAWFTKILYRKNVKVKSYA